MENQINVSSRNTQQIVQKSSENLDRNSIPKRDIKTLINNKKIVVLILSIIILLFLCTLVLYLQVLNRSKSYKEPQKTNQQSTSSQNQLPLPTNTTMITKSNAFDSVSLNDADIITYYEFTYDKQGIIWVTDKVGINKKKLIWSTSSPTILAIDWSPDGNKIAFTADFLSERSSKSGLYIYDGIKNEVKFIAPSIDVTGGTTNNGAWSKDSKYFAYLSGISSGSGPLYLYDSVTDKVSTISIPFSENLGGPISWLNSSHFYLRSWNPVQYCNSATTDCPIEKESSAKSGFSLIRANPTTFAVDKLVTRKLSEGAIDRYLADEINNVIYLSGRDENVYKYNIQTSAIEKINVSDMNDKRVFLSETYIPSPNGDRFIAIKDEGMGYTSTRVVVFKTLQSKLISDYNNTDTGRVTDWYDNDTILKSSSKLELIDINTLNKKQLMNFANTTVFAKVRPTQNK